MEKELPKNWCISRYLTSEQNKIVTDWINNKFGYFYGRQKITNCWYIYPNLNCENDIGHKNYIPENYKELSFKEFEKQIINYETYVKFKEDYKYLIPIIKQINKLCLNKDHILYV